MFHKVVWQHMQGVMEFLIAFYCKFTKESSSGQYFENRLRFERIMATSLWPRFFGPSCIYDSPRRHIAIRMHLGE